MDAIIYKSVLGLFFALPIAVNSATEQAATESDQPTAEKWGTILLESNDGYRFRVKREIASLSRVVASRLEDYPKTKIIPLLEIDSKSLLELLPLMELASTVAKEPLVTKINTIGALIDQKLREKSLKAWKKLLHIIDYLDIEILKRPFADRMIKYIRAQWLGGGEPIDDVISKLTISDEMRGLLAKYWYLNFSNSGSFILPSIDYGFSIEELAAYNKLPSIKNDMLDLNQLRINDLTGLNTIPNILSVQIINCMINALTTIPEDIFKGFNQLRRLFLGFNRFEKLHGNCFSGLNQLEQLALDNNKLSWMSPDSFNGLEKLNVLWLYNNDLTKLPEELFANLKNLTSLDLSTNKIEKLSENIFRTLHQLDVIDFNKNKLTELPEHIFSGLDKLRFINFNENQLTSLPVNIFKGLDNLQYIHLENNMITFLELSIFTRLPKLRLLDLRGNPLNPETQTALKALLGEKVKL